MCETRSQNIPTTILARVITGLRENQFIPSTHLISPFRKAPFLPLTRLMRKLHFLNCSVAPISFLAIKCFSQHSEIANYRSRLSVETLPLKSQPLVGTQLHRVSSKPLTGTKQTWVPHPSMLLAIPKPITGPGVTWSKHLEEANVTRASALCPACGFPYFISSIPPHGPA